MVLFQPVQNLNIGLVLEATDINEEFATTFSCHT